MAARSRTVSFPPAGSSLATKLARLGLHRDADLVLHLPLRWEDETRITPIRDLLPGATAQLQAVVREAKGVISGARSDDATTARRPREQQQGVARSALLERSGSLKALELAEHARARDLRKSDGLRTGSDEDAGRDAAPSHADVLERHTHR